MLNLICGVSGSGKTARITEQIRADILQKKTCYLLVPEQQAYISEFEIPTALPPEARLYFEVVHFSGLSDKIFRKYGGVTETHIQGGLKTLLMWETLRELAPMLKQYGKNATRDVSLTALMLQTVNELRMNGLEPERMEEIAKSLPEDSSLQKKLFDLALIDSVFVQKTEAAFGSDLPDRLLRMSKLLTEHRFFEDCNIYIDSFTSFTMQEYRVLREILRQADNVTVALCTDGVSTKLSHFKTPAETGLRLLHLASEVSVPVKKEQLLPKSAGKSRVLSTLERDLWRFDLRPDEREHFSPEELDSVRLLKASNLYEESEAAALNILALVQSGMHYQDIVVTVRDTETYRGVLDAALERYGIPYFLSERTNLSAKPIFRLILSALRAVSRHYPTQDVLTLVKTGLVGVDYAEAAMFEEYCETWHIRGSRFLEPVWSMNPDGLTTEKSPRGEAILNAANAVRRKVIEPLSRFAADLRTSRRLCDRCAALYRYLCDLNIPEQLAERAKTELRAGQKLEAGETVRLYRFVVDTLTTLSTILPDTEMTVDEFLLALNMVFSETDLGSVPNAPDCVIIGSASTLRVERVRAMLLLGLCEGEFPATVTDSGVLSEADKRILEDQFEVRMDSREHVRTSEELLYVYRAVTKPTDQLILSTVATQPDGSVRTPSLAFTRVAYLLQKKTPEEFDASLVRQNANRVFSCDPASVPRSDPSTPITLHLSHSKLRSFLLCPYSYYSSYRLKLREPKDSRPSYADDGSFLHYVFEHFLSDSLDEDGNLIIPEQVRIAQMTERIVEDYLHEIFPDGADRTDRHLLHLFSRLERMAQLMLQNILAELHTSRYVPYRFEQIIGGTGKDGIPAPILTLKDGSRVQLSGRIDRVDLYRANGRIYLRVVDYKTGKHEFKLQDVASGLDIQLVLYLFAALAKQDKSVLPAGAHYMYIQNEKSKLTVKRSGFLLQDDEIHPVTSESKPFFKGLAPTPAEEIAALEPQMHEAVLSAAERILAGEAQKTPSREACQYCAIRKDCDRAYHE